MHGPTLGGFLAPFFLLQDPPGQVRAKSIKGTLIGRVEFGLRP